MREWTEPVAIEDHPERLVRYADDTVSRDVDITLTEDQYREMRAGYRCCRCYGMVAHAFPESCGFPGCDGYPDGFPMKERQLQVMDEEYDGYKWVGISKQTYDRLQAEEEVRERARSKGIYLP